MKSKGNITIGDAVEVKVLERSPFKRGAAVKWLPATISYVTDNEIGVTFSDHERLALPRYSREWQLPR